jgi:cytochrome b
MRRVKVWDLFVRLSHWSAALLVLGSFLTSEVDGLRSTHVRLGLGLLALVLARIAWGFLGPAPARFSAFVRRPGEVLAYARELAAGRPPIHLSHNPLGGAMVLALLAALLGLVATGAVTYAGPEFSGPLSGVLTKQGAHAVKELHEGLAGLLLGLVAAHVAGVLFSSWRERQNLVAGMITGWKRAPESGHAEDPRESGGLSRAARLGAALALGSAGALAVALLLGVPVRVFAASSVADGLLREYEATARQQRPGFLRFSAEEGRKLYSESRVQDGQPISCSTCHTDHPRQAGRTPAGKIVEPLAPSANPRRFSDRRDVEKWFKRNCKQVLGRECTAEEKGNFMTYVLGA